ncbi:MAG: ABC transporter substrate-binding protein [Beutenbergiaceae bacterium]
MKSRVTFMIAGVAALALGLAACSGDTSGDEPSGDTSSGDGGGDMATATILTNWFAQAEQGGYWAAQAEGLATDRGVELTVNQGGPGIQTIPQVAAGEADFGVGNADEVLVAVESGVPIVAVAAGPARNLQCMAYHEASGISSFTDLNGYTVARVPSPYWDYIRESNDLTDVNEINIADLATFQNDPNMVTQCFITSEPYILEQAGVTDVGFLLVGEDGGYNAYQNLLFTTQSFIDENPDTVQAVVEASMEGWQAMIEDPTATKQLILATNTDGDPGVFDYTVNLFTEDSSYLGDAPGTMTDERWSELGAQLEEIDMLPEGFDVTQAYTLEFSNS